MSRGQLAVFSRFQELVERGQREGSIRTDVEARDVAWAVLMFAWAEDYGLLQGVDQPMTEGASLRNFKRLLACFAPPPR
jgi:hypothetical protein